MNRDDTVTAETRRSEGRTSPRVESAVLRRVVSIVVWVFVFGLWTATRHLPYVSALLFVLLGVFALLLTTFSVSALHATILRAAVFWETAARAAWATGVLGTVVFFVSVLSGPSEGLEVAATNLALSFVPSVYGFALAAGFLARAFRMATADGSTPQVVAIDGASPGREARMDSALDRWLGRVLFAVLVAWPLVQARLAATDPRLAASIWMFYWPAVLVLLGTVLAIRLIGGAKLRERAASVAWVGAGVLCALAGLARALLGMAAQDIAGVSSGISFLVTTCFTTLVGLALVTFSMDDRSRLRHEMNGAVLAARIAWVVFPLVTVGLMVIVFIMILTPMTRRV